MGFSRVYGGVTCIDHEIPYDLINSADQKYLGWLLYTRFDDIDQCIEKDKARQLKFLEYLENFACQTLDINSSKAFQSFRKFINWLYLPILIDIFSIA